MSPRARRRAILLALAAAMALALIWGVAASYGDGAYGAGGYGAQSATPAPTGDSHRGGGGGAGRWADAAQATDAPPQESQAASPQLEMPADAWRPTSVPASGVDDLRTEMMDVREQMASYGLSTDRVDELIDGASTMDNVALVRDLRNRAILERDDALLARAGMRMLREQIESGNHAALSSLIGYAVADADETFTDSEGLVASAQSAYENGDYTLAANQIMDAERTYQTGHSRLIGSRIWTIPHIVLWWALFVALGVIGAIGLHLLDRGAVVPAASRAGKMYDIATALLLSVIIIVTVLATFGVAWGTVILQQEHESVRDTTQDLSSATLLYLRGVQIAAENLGTMAGASLPTPGEGDPAVALDRLAPSIQRIAQSADGIVGAYVYLDPGTYGNVSYVWMLKRDGSWVRQEDSEIGDPQYLTADDPRSNDPDYAWYFMAMRRRVAGWTGVYTDTDINVTMISYVGPVVVGERVVGIYGMDLALETATERFRSLRTRETQEVFLMDDHQNIIVQPATDLPWMQDKMDLLRGDSGIFETDGWIVAHQRISTGQRVVVVASSVEVEGLIGTLRRRFLLLTTVLGVLLVVSIVGVVRISVSLTTKPPRDEMPQGRPFTEPRRIIEAFRRVLRR